MKIAPNIVIRHKDVLAYMTETDKVIIGLQRPRLLLMAAYAARGHILAKAKPGTAKSTLMKVTGKVFEDAVAMRLQMTADVKPAKITGYTVETVNGKQERPSPLKGVNLLHVDEFDNANPQTQRAFLEGMAEAQFTIDGVTTRLEKICQFMAVINGTESEGTFPIGNAASDRFMFFIDWPLLSREQLVQINQNERLDKDHPEDEIKAVLSLKNIEKMRQDTQEIITRSSDAVLEYIAELACSVDPDRDEFKKVLRQKDGTDTFADLVSWGGAERLNQYLKRASAAIALFTGSENIQPHHVKFIFPDAARPHFKMSNKSRFGEARETQDSFIKRILETVPER